MAYGLARRLRCPPPMRGSTRSSAEPTGATGRRILGGGVPRLEEGAVAAGGRGFRCRPHGPWRSGTGRRSVRGGPSSHVRTRPRLGRRPSRRPVAQIGDVRRARQRAAPRSTSSSRWSRSSTASATDDGVPVTERACGASGPRGSVATKNPPPRPGSIADAAVAQQSHGLADRRSGQPAAPAVSPRSSRPALPALSPSSVSALPRTDGELLGCAWDPSSRRARPPSSAAGDLVTPSGTTDHLNVLESLSRVGRHHRDGDEGVRCAMAPSRRRRRR